MGIVVEVTDATFEQEVLKSELPVLVDFWAPRCPPCAALAPVLEKLAEDLKEKVKFVKVNVTQGQTVAAKYRVQAVPTLVVIKGGEVVDSAVGYQPEQELRKRISRVSE
jgi:thioredoxin 1